MGSPESSSTLLQAILVRRTVRALSLQELAWVACRPHVMELSLPAVFSSLVGSTGVPYFALFRRFQQTWPSIMTRQRHMKWLLMTCLTVTHQEQIVQFCKSASEGLHQRDAYKEFLQMSLIFFGS